MSQAQFHPISNGDLGYGTPANSRSGPSSPPNLKGPMRHIQDLQHMAKTRYEAFDPNAPIGRLLHEASMSSGGAENLVQYKRPDLAYVEFLVAMELIACIIPHHKDAPALHHDRGSVYRENKALVKRIAAMSDQFDGIKASIEADNRRSGVVAAFGPESALPGRQRPSTALGDYGERNSGASSPRSSVIGVPSRNSRPSSLNEAEGVRTTFNRWEPPEGSVSGRSNADMHHPASLRPAVRPKPANLHGGANNGAAASRTGAPDPLNDRFARLRAGGLSETDSDLDERNGRVTSPLSMPNPSEYRNDLSRAAAASRRPVRPTRCPPRPPKLPLDTAFSTALPKAPSPTYSPARNMPTPGGINPPRSTARSMVGTGGRNNFIASSVSNTPLGANGDMDSYFPDTDGDRQGGPGRRKSVYMPSESQISAEVLYDYLKLFHVLLIDCRPRENFDSGHIFHQNVMCVEPAALRQGMSAAQLQDALVLSPEKEQDMFDRRCEFIIVVYYDESTVSNDFLQRPPRDDNEAALKDLYTSIHEFNGDVPLKRPPIFLMGGLMAWTDLLGPQALIASTPSYTERAKASRPIKRVPPGSKSQIYVRKRRREYNPLDAEEERKWAERARTESIAIRDAQLAEELEEGEEEEAIPIYRTTSEFMRRYPEIPPAHRESMTSPASRPAPVPGYPANAMQSPPSRPAPAVPPVAYRGAHEREPSSHNVVARGQRLASYVPQSDMLHNIRLPRTGLVNFGSTCYMNATIQCLNATWPLSRDFRSGVYRKSLQRDNWKGTKGLLSDNFANLIGYLWKGDVNACRPSTFRNFCARLNSEWGSDRQQDAKEFFDFLLDYLHEDLNANWKNPPPHVLTPMEEQLRERTPKPFASKVEWARFSKRDRSMISQLFAGQHASRLTCTVCTTTSTTYEAFYSISVEIPRSSSTATIEECLQSFCTEELLSGEELWKCPKCKAEREAKKKITITRVPSYLVVHFKRFSASHYESARKVRTPIDFPIEGLDLEPFVIPPPTAAEVSQAIANRGVESVRTDYALDETMTPPYRYNCYAVMRHIGSTLHSGHYTAMVRDPGRGCWRAFNDERTADFDPMKLGRGDRLQNEQAYIVFYERDMTGVGAQNGYR